MDNPKKWHPLYPGYLHPPPPFPRPSGRKPLQGAVFRLYKATLMLTVLVFLTHFPFLPPL